jgi:hypothetical protein
MVTRFSFSGKLPGYHLRPTWKVPDAPEYRGLMAIIDDMLGTLQAGYYYAALNIALQIPDVCSSLEVDRDLDDRIWRGTDKRYRAWCDAYLMKHYHYLTADQLWGLRGGIVHNARLSGLPKLEYERVAFVPPGSPVYMHENLAPSSGDPTKRSLMIDLETFCYEMIQAMKDWFAAWGEDAIVQRNLPHLVHTRENGMRPFYKGFPIVA